MVILDGCPWDRDYTEQSIAYRRWQARQNGQGKDRDMQPHWIGELEDCYSEYKAIDDVRSRQQAELERGRK